VAGSEIIFWKEVTMEVQPITVMVVLSGILTGLVFGFVLQRGRY